MLHRTSYHYLTRWISRTVHINSVDAVVSFVNTFTTEKYKNIPSCEQLHVALPVAGRDISRLCLLPTYD